MSNKIVHLEYIAKYPKPKKRTSKIIFKVLLWMFVSATSSRRFPGAYAPRLALLSLTEVQQAQRAKRQQRPRRRFRNGIGISITGDEIR